MQDEEIELNILMICPAAYSPAVLSTVCLFLLTLLVGLFEKFSSCKNEWKGLFLLSKNFNAKTML